MNGIYYQKKTEDDYLAHYGVKGMKWGVRRTPEQLGHKPKSNTINVLTGSGKLPVETRTMLRSKDELTDEGLRKRINKLVDKIEDEWERKYKTGEKFNPEQIAIEKAQPISTDIYTTRSGSERDKLISNLSVTLDASVFDDPGILAINNKTGKIESYESSGDIYFGNKVQKARDADGKYINYNTKSLDEYYGYEKGTVDYYEWGRKQPNDTAEHSEDVKQDDILHYGVVGMKWGVRRFQPYSSDYKGKGKEVGEAKKKSSKKFDYDDDIVIKKGTKAYRISANKSDTGDSRYITVDQNDRNFYKGMWPTTLKGTAGVYGKDQKIYEHKYKTTEDLISPSAAKRQKIASDLAKTDEVQNEIAYGLALGRIRKSNNWSLQETKDAFDYWTNKKEPGYLEYMKKIKSEVKQNVDNQDEAGQAIYMLGAMGNSDRLKAIYGKKIVEQGYNMVIDDHGADFAGNKQRVNAPIIALKAEQSLKQIGAKTVSDYDSRSAMIVYQSDVKSIPGSKSEKLFVPNVIKEYYGTKNYYDNDTFDWIYDSNNQKIR